MTSANNDAYIARQPILDHTGNIFAYELLFRNSPCAQHAGAIPNAVQATAQVLEIALNNMGVQKLVGPHKAFINCSRDMLLSGVLKSLDPGRFVLEILETVQVDNELIESVSQLRHAGFELALDDFVFSAEDLRRALPLFPYVKYIKIDLIGNRPHERAEAARLLKDKGKIMLAEKVETEGQHHQCRQEGYELFQGYFFAKPELLSSRKLDPKVGSILQLLQVIRKDPDISELEAAFKRHPDMTLNLLRYMNSAAIALRNPINSVRQAIALVGLSNLQQWLTIMLYARPDSGSAAAQSPLFENAVQRARFLEDVAKRLSPKSALVDQAFLAGILSRMDALCRTPMQNILAEYDLGSEISNALLKGNGVLGQLLMLVSALESDAAELVGESLNTLKLSESDFQKILEDSYSWMPGVGK